MRLTAREVAVWVAILGSPFVSSLWTHAYWSQIRDHLLWIVGETVDGPGHGAGFLAGCFVFIVHAVLIARLAVKKRRL